MRASHPYPFPVSLHTLWILRQLLDRPRQWNLRDDEIFIVSSFNEVHEPSIENDYYTCEILKYLEREDIINLYTGSSKGIKEYTLPLPDKPMHRMVAEWEVTVKNKYLLTRLLGKVSYRARVKMADKLDEYHARFEVDADSIFWMKTEVGSYPLRQLNFEMTSYKVVATLCEEGFVELNDAGLIYNGRYAGTKVRSLQESLRGVGFDKLIKDTFFAVSTNRIIKLKSPPPAFRRSFHDAIIEQFEESSRLRQKLNNKTSTKRKNDQYDR